MWTAFVELIRVGIFAAAHVCGGSVGAGVVAVSVAVRLALLPLTLRLARQARARQARLAALAPELERLKRRHGADPVRLMRETQALYAAHGVRAFGPEGVVGLVVQLPLLGALFAAVRGGLGARVPFLWIGDLARPDALLVAVVALVGGGILAIPQPQSPPAGPGVAVLFLIGVGGTLAFLWTASSAVALSAGAGSLVSGLQSWLLSRDRAQPVAPACHRRGGTPC